MSNALIASQNNLTSTAEELNSLATSLNSYAGSANSATSLSTYNSYVSSYNSSLSTYNTTKTTYDNQLETYTNISNTNKAEVITYDIPNFKDENQWRPGGYLQNEKLAGGYLFNPTYTPSVEEKPKLDEPFQMNNGSLHGFLNVGFTSIQNDLHGFDFLDLFRDYTDTKTIMYKVTVTTDNGTKEDYITITDNGEGKGPSDGSIDYGLNAQYTEMRPSELAGMFNTTGINLFSQDLMSSVVSISIENLMSGELWSSPNLTVKNFIGASVIKTINTMFSQQITMGISKTLGLKSIYAMGAISIGIGMLIGEFMEMATGYDKAFGYGGEYSVDASKAFGQDSFADSRGFMGIESGFNSLAYSLGFSDSLRTGYQNNDGNTIGMGLTMEGSYGMNDITGYGATYDLAMNDYYDRVTYDFSVEYVGYTYDYMVDYDTEYSQYFGLTESIGEIQGAFGEYLGLNDMNEDVYGGWGLDENFSSGFQNDEGGFNSFGDAQSHYSAKAQSYGQNLGGGGNSSSDSSTSGGGNTKGSNSSQGSWSCFIAGTIAIVVENNKQINKKIEDVVIGEYLLGLDNSINKVVEYDRPITHGRPIYGFNGKQEFTTTEHMFLTTEGWKALIPEHAKEHHHETFKKLGMNLNSVLSVGDILILKDNKQEELETISVKEVDYNTKLYNFKLGGNNTYVANGYIVHNK